MASIRWQLFLVFVICLNSAKTQVYDNEIKPPNNIIAGKSVTSSSSTSKTRISVSKSTRLDTSTEIVQSKAAPTSAPNLICPGNDTGVPLFTLPCERDGDCALLGPGLRCCMRKDIRFKRCLKGVPAPKPEPPHSPWLRIFPRKCPESPLAELREIKSCNTDNDCNSRICCPERGTSESYCRTASIQFDNFPTVKRMVEPITSLAGYLQCTPSPPSVLDIFVKECKSALDCFPNLCCQEKGRRVCRPPRQSIFSFFAGMTRNIASSSNQMTNSIINTIRN